MQTPRNRVSFPNVLVLSVTVTVLASSAVLAAPDVRLGPPPSGDTCEDAIDIEHGEFVLTGDTSLFDDNYCVAGDYGCEAPEVVYSFVLPPGDRITCELAPSETNFIMYLVNDCWKIEEGYIMHSSGDPEFLEYANENTSDVWLNLMVDGNGVGEAGPFVLTGTNQGHGQVPTERLAWSQLKAWYK